MQDDKESKVEERLIESVIFSQIERKENLQIADKLNKFFIESIISIRDTIPIFQLQT